MLQPAARIWVTRTRPRAEETARRLSAMGFSPIVAPVLQVRTIADVTFDLDGAASLAFTSGNGVAAFAELTSRRDLAVFVTGQATAEVARACGFADVVSADGDVGDLAALIAARAPQGVVVHPGAREPAGDLAGALAGAGVEVRTLAVYETVETGAAPPPDLDAALIHSPRAAAVIARALAGAQASPIRLYAISPAAAEPLRASNFQPVAVAQYPNEIALLKLLND